MALDEYIGPPTIVVLRGAAEDLDVWRAELDKLYDPRRLVLAVPSAATGLPAALSDKRPQARTVAYVCRGTTCSAPARDLATRAALKALNAADRPVSRQPRSAAAACIRDRIESPRRRPVVGPGVRSPQRLGLVARSAGARGRAAPARGCRTSRS